MAAPLRSRDRDARPDGHVYVGDGDGLTIETDTPGLGRRDSSKAWVSLHVESGHVSMGARPRLVDAVLDDGTVASCTHLLVAVPLGETEILDRVRERCQVTDTHPASVTCLMGVDQTTTPPRRTRDDRSPRGGRNHGQTDPTPARPRLGRRLRHRLPRLPTQRIARVGERASRGRRSARAAHPCAAVPAHVRPADPFRRGRAAAETGGCGLLLHGRPAQAAAPPGARR